MTNLEQRVATLMVDHGFSGSATESMALLLAFNASNSETTRDQNTALAQLSRLLGSLGLLAPAVPADDPLATLGAQYR